MNNLKFNKQNAGKKKSNLDIFEVHCQHQEKIESMLKITE